VTAGNDLIGDDPIADGESFNAGAEFDNMAKELMPRHNGFSDPFRLAVTAPVSGGAVPGFDVASTDAASFDLDNDLISSSGRDRNGLEL